MWIHVTKVKHWLNCQTLPAVCTTSATMAVKLKKVASKLLTKQANYVGRWSRDHTSHVIQGTQGMLEDEHVSLQDMLAS